MVAGGCEEPSGYRKLHHLTVTYFEIYFHLSMCLVGCMVKAIVVLISMKLYLISAYAMRQIDQS